MPRNSAARPFDANYPQRLRRVVLAVNVGWRTDAWAIGAILKLAEWNATWVAVTSARSSLLSLSPL